MLNSLTVLPVILLYDGTAACGGESFLLLANDMLPLFCGPLLRDDHKFRRLWETVDLMEGLLDSVTSINLDVKVGGAYF